MTQNQSQAYNALQNLRLRLLDLTARNQLLNFRHTRMGSLRIIDELPDQLADTLLSDTEMRFLPVPEPTRDELVQAEYIKIEADSGLEIRLKKDPTAEEWANYLGLSTSYEMPVTETDTAQAKHTDKAIQTLLYPFELEARLKNLMQNSESAIQEMGANILYLSFGFLEWVDQGQEDIRIAPLFLLPVRLHKGRLNPKTKTYEYTLSYSGEDILPNLSLREKLRIDFALALPDFEENITPEAYFRAVQELITKNQPRWQVRRYITLSLLNFSKLMMYLDLDPGRWPAEKNIIDHTIITEFLNGYQPDDNTLEENPATHHFGEEYPIDEMDAIHDRYPLIDDADSSQHSALIDAMDGKNLIIEGPPGTGKSQTITNLIAAAMANGKRVLFVAEKLAALEVVRRRLDAAGLGEFCLELHSHKSQKRKVLDEIEVRLSKHSQYRKPARINSEIKRCEELKAQLKHYVEAIHQPWKETGQTIHAIFMAATRYREALGINPETLHPAGHHGDSLNASTLQQAEDQVDTFARVFAAVVEQLAENGTLQNHPWHGVQNANLQVYDLERVLASLSQWQNSLKYLNQFRTEQADTLQTEQQEIAETLDGFEKFLNDLDHVPALQGDEQLDCLPNLQGETLDAAITGRQLFETIQALYALLLEKVSPDVLGDLSKVEHYRTGIDRLSQLTHPEIELKHLFESLERLKQMQGQIAQWKELIPEIENKLGAEARGFISLTTEGLEEFKALVDLLGELKISHLKLRDPLFDNEELDEILPEMDKALKRLATLRDDLQPYYRLDLLGSSDELVRLKATLDAGGIFRWLKGSWRGARQQLLDLAAGPRVKFSAMRSLISKAVDYLDRKQKIESNRRYAGLLADHFKGMKTDIDTLNSLRDWYKKVRRHYGIGFGKKVALGTALINLPLEPARNIRALSEQEVPLKIGNFLRDLTGLKSTFKPYPALQNDSLPLTGENGIIAGLSAALQEALGLCQPLLSDNSLTIAQLAERIESLGQLHDAVREWEKLDYDNRFFQGRLGLKTGIHADNQAALSALDHTLTLATIIERDITSGCIRNFLYQHPVVQSFDILKTMASQLRTALSEQTAGRDQFTQLMDLDLAAWMVHSSDHLDKLIARNDHALRHDKYLSNWLDYLRVRAAIVAAGLENLAAMLERGELNLTRIQEAHRAGYYDLLAREILLSQPELAGFSGQSHEAIQAQFCKCDNRLKTLQCERIAWQIDQVEIPEGVRGARVSEHTDRYLLEHECSKKTRHIPIRQLLKRAGNALVALKPCFMMGPMSVAQYLEPGKNRFDLVIMDEASQIKPQDALGAIARGSQLVVVGDPKQLPPTNFFDRILVDDIEDPSALEESESILDATWPMFPARRRLRWHYRSRHEQLIAFSNYSFYGGDLVLFPSPFQSAENYGVQYTRLLRGCFVNRRNLEEAKTIAQTVREHITQNPDLSLGVVAMSAEQRLLIERTIETLAKEDEIFRDTLEQDALKLEPLFIKNLENVQGDERDVIFISMTYGPKEPGGKVYQRFGPINTDVGWRRLNVLFTRSRQRMHIFSSMDSQDIIADRTAKRGVKALRDFLSYCETGVLHRTETESQRAPDSDFEIAVMAALNEEGFACVPQVGVAGFYIDVAVVDPGNPGRYLMGIECDGASYHSAKSVRDRDRLKQMVLERLGWRIHRIWSTDWFKNPQAQLQPLIRELNKLKSQPVISEPEAEAPQTTQPRIGDHIFTATDLESMLIEFDNEVIRKARPETPQYQRLLRPAMLEAFMEYRPSTQSEYLETMPQYLRQATDTGELAFLEKVLEIININIENTQSEKSA